MALPFFIIGVATVGVNKGISKRLSDMTGYTAREKLITVLASCAPYPFMIATVWMPLTPTAHLLCPGLLACFSGMVLFAASLRAIKQTPPGERFAAGPYRYSRNPMYVSANLVFAGICLGTANLAISAYLAVAILLQHFMILAEERICREKYGAAFEQYLREVPRYLIV